MAMEMPTSATDRALLVPHPLAVVAFAISQALFERALVNNSFCDNVSPTQSSAALHSFTTRHETRADQSLAAQFCNPERCPAERHADRDLQDASQLSV
jgi:hypothetical protein